MMKVVTLVTLLCIVGVTSTYAFECGVRTYAQDVCLWPDGAQLDGLNGGTASDICEMVNNNPLDAGIPFPTNNPISQSTCRDAIYADGDACVTAYAKYVCSKRCAACVQLVCAPVCTQLASACTTAASLGCLTGASCSDATTSCTNWNVNINAIPAPPTTTTAFVSSTPITTRAETATTTTTTTSSAHIVYVASWMFFLVVVLIAVF